MTNVRRRLKAYGWFKRYKNGVVELTLSDNSTLRIPSIEAEYISGAVNQ